MFKIYIFLHFRLFYQLDTRYVTEEKESYILILELSYAALQPAELPSRHEWKNSVLVFLPTI